MDAREELKADIGNAYATAVQAGFDSAHWESPIADLLFAAGYRKMPDREAIILVLAENGLDADGREPHSWRCSDKDRYPGDCTCPAEIAEDILALMDGNK